MKNVLKNWKTSLLGGGALTGAAANLINDPTNWKQSVLMALVGLLGLFAKDQDVTGTHGQIN